MTLLMLGEREQAAVSALIAAEPMPGTPLPGQSVLPILGRLIECDASGIAVLDRAGSTLNETPHPPARASGEGSPATDGPTLGIHERRHRATPDAGHPVRDLAVLSLGVRNGHDHVVKLWMVRRTTDFSGRDRAVLRLLSPALERLMRETPASGVSGSLTAQEARVLRHVAAGRSNAEIAELLVVAPCTVHKHLEHAYRKLGVTNRMAAVLALQNTHGSTPSRRAP